MKTIGNISVDGEVRAVASGTLPNGRPVIVNADGTVSVVAEATVNTPSLATRYSYGGTPLYNAAVYDSNSNKVVIVYEDRDLSTEGTAIVGTVSGEVITFGTPVSFSSGGVRDVGATFDSTNNKVIICYNDTGNSQYGTAVVGTVSGTSISFGTNLVYESNTTYGNKPAYDSNSNDVVIAYRANIASNQGKCAVCSVSGTSLTRSDTVTFTNDLSTSIDIKFDSNLNKFLIVYTDEDNSNYGTARVGTISGGTTLSLGSATVFNASSSLTFSLSFDTTANKFLLIYRDVGNNNYGKARVATISGSSVSFGTEVTFFSDRVDSLTSSYDSVENKTLVVIGSSTATPASGIVAATISGTSVSFGTLGDLGDLFSGGNAHLGAVYDSNAGKIVFCGLNSQSNGAAAVGKFTSTGTTLTSENYIGMSGGAVTSETVTQALGSVVDITNAPPEYLAMAYDDDAGKVVVAYKLGSGNEYGYAAVGTVSGTSITFGTPVAYTSSALQSASQSIAYDAVNNKVVISFTLQGGGNRYGTAIVGTVSGTSISFGSAVTFNAGVTAWITSVFDSSNNKVVIAYNDGGNSSYGTAIVGTVSGTDISFGSEVVFESANSSYLGSAFDSTNNKVVISYRDDGNSGKGTAIVGTVSGTSISFGTAAVFNNASTYWTNATFDSTNGKAVVVYMDDGNSQYGTSVVGTVSGTDISFGSEVVFSASSTTAPVAAFDSGVGKVTVAYRNAGNSNNTTIVPATVSGTSISFDTAVDVGVVNGGGESIGIVFDSTNNRIVTAFKDDTANENSAVVFQNAGTIISRGQVESGSVATIQTGCSINSGQLDLTAGQDYYVQTDGTLGLTAADPSVLAGTAVSATKLIVKG